MSKFQSAPNWGNIIKGPRAITPFKTEDFGETKNAFLPYGNGRSYGDSCHNDSGVLLDARKNNSILNLDLEKGILVAETGILFSEILEALKPHGLFLPVVPGTKFITLGGAIANDIHGKNHGHRGTFGSFVKSLTLATSDGQVQTCTRLENKPLFQATIGGMGLTGFIIDAEIDLIRVPSHHVKESKTKFNSINEFIALSEEIESKHEYSVAWVDSLASGKTFGRGVLIAGDHCKNDTPVNYQNPKFNIPFTPPIPLVSGLPLKLFNLGYYYRNALQREPRIAAPNSFFFPLDAIGGWNKLYGPKGLYQHQCVLPFDTGPEALHALLRTSQLANHGSFLTVLKRFGGRPSPGLISFPKPGFTLTLDFPNKGLKTRELLDELDAITLEAGGRVNPYKDARMSAETFQRGFPNWQELEALRDPVMISDFWKRVTQNPPSRARLRPPSMETNNINHTTKPPLQVHPVEKR